MALRFFNTYSRELEEFRPLDPGGRAVKMYTCGPTVYSYAHIGNFRAYLFEDLLQRHLEARGFAVQRVMNLTDVDDKTIRGCQAAGVPLAEFTQPFKDAFFEDLDTEKSFFEKRSNIGRCHCRCLSRVWMPDEQSIRRPSCYTRLTDPILIHCPTKPQDSLNRAE